MRCEHGNYSGYPPNLPLESGARGERGKGALQHSFFFWDKGLPPHLANYVCNSRNIVIILA